VINEKKWVKLWIIITILIPIIALLNYVIDPNGMNNKILIEGVNSSKKSNTGYSYRFKTNRLIDDEFDTLMLGTSRIGVMDPNVVNSYVNGKTFNLEAPASTTEMQYKLFKYALKHNNIKNVVYGIDFMAFNGSRTLDKTFPEFKSLNKKIVNGEKISNYDLYFNLDTTKSSFYVLYKNLSNQKIVAEQFLQNGMRVFFQYIDSLEKGTYNYNERMEYTFHEYYNNFNGIYKNFTYSKEYLDYFSKIIKECKDNNIKIWVYIPPVYNLHFDSLKSAGYYEQFEKFKRDLVKITNYIDFTGRNTITNDANNFWDSSHLRAKITKPLMAKIFHDKSVDVPKDFGVLVTPENIETHLKNLRGQIKEFDLEKMLAYQYGK
jgi:hypothetical protein